MSTVVATNINTDALVGSASANAITVRGEGSATTSLQQGLCKAWATINATGTAAVRDSFMSSSLTDNSSGDFSFGHTTNFAANTTYTAGGLAGHSGASNTTYTMSPYSDGTLLTSSSRYSMRYNTSNAEGVSDYVYGAISMHGDLA